MKGDVEADMMIEAVPRLLGMESYDVIIPVPLHRKVRKKRGYNHMELIGRQLSKATGTPMDTKALFKIRNTPRQSDAALRTSNVRGSFDIPDPPRVQGKRILLIDDLYVSGAIVNEASRTLAQAKVSFVDILTLARSVDA